jgi:hypothetical protein
MDTMTEKGPALVILAAGVGSRFGGLKQMTPVGPSGEMILDYSIYDALTAGFSKIVFVINHTIEESFKETIGDRIARSAAVDYVYQELDCLPEGAVVPAGRKKPWGTGHAVLCCRGVVDGPFAVINADDYYGRSCFKLLHDFLVKPCSDPMLHMAMVGFILENTLTENGYVSRGICAVDERGYLRDIVERVHIEKRGDRVLYTEDKGNTWEPLTPGCQVSMNCWAFPEGTLDFFEEKFNHFLQSDGDMTKAEFYLPFAVDSIVKDGKGNVRVLKTSDKWYGMTYQEDRKKVIDAIRSLVVQGVYPERLWRN